MNLSTNAAAPPLPPEDHERVLTTSEAARLLGISVSTAQSWMESGALASWKTPGGHRRVRLSEVLRQLSSAPAAPSDEQAAHEQHRIAALNRSGLLDNGSNDVFDRLTWLAGQVTEAPIALMTLLTPTVQWFKSRQGLAVNETPRAWAFCNHTIAQDELFSVSDARQDGRFQDNPLVTRDPHVRFYAGVPLRDLDGFKLGALCVIDTEPRLLTSKQARGLRELAAIASSEIAHLSVLRS